MPLGATVADTSGTRVRFEPVAFDALPGWNTDDHADAFGAFRASADILLGHQPAANSRAASPGLLAACTAALTLGATPSAAEAKVFFERRFTPHRVVHDGPTGLLTGYYEPLVEGSRKQSARFSIPVLRRPADLVNLVAESERGAMAHALTHARKTLAGIEPYVTRQEIEQGALDGRGLELLWLADPVDAFFMHIQGSGQVALDDGETIRITYDGKNGHPYTSVGRYLIDAGLFPAEAMTLDALRAWLAADPERGSQTMWQNRSYVFFRELSGAEAESALGVMSIPLHPGRSLAVDTAFHAIGTPVYVTAPELAAFAGDGSFQRLMIGQDVGSAIRGPERGDIYFGSGPEAGRRAGVTKHPGSFHVLVADENS